MLDKKSVLREQRVFAANFKAARQTMGLKQTDITEVSGLGQDHISDVERNVAGIGLDSMIALSHAIKIPLYLLLDPSFDRLFRLELSKKIWDAYLAKSKVTAIPYERYLFAKNFKAARTNLKLTQVAISEATGFPNSSLGYVEKGEISVYFNTAIRLASAVGIPIHILFCP